MEKEMKRNRIIIIISFIIGIIGIILFSYNYIFSKINLTFETINLELYGNKEPEKVNETIEEKEEVKEEAPSPTPSVPSVATSPSYDYIGYIEIPKINLKQGFVDINSAYNDVDKNIQIIKPSNYPNVPKGNFILASHSGNSSISYFKHLYNVKVNDQVMVYYQNNKYTYKIVNIYDVPKKGEVAIHRDSNKTTITLITCTRGSDTLQTVYIGYLESTVKI